MKARRKARRFGQTCAKSQDRLGNARRGSRRSRELGGLGAPPNDPVGRQVLRHVDNPAGARLSLTPRRDRLDRSCELRARFAHRYAVFLLNSFSRAHFPGDCRTSARPTPFSAFSIF